MPRRSGPVNYTTESVIDERAASHVQSAVTPARPVSPGAHGAVAPGAHGAVADAYDPSPTQGKPVVPDAGPRHDGRGVPDRIGSRPEKPASGNGTRQTKPSDLVTRAAAITRKGPTPDYREPSAAGQSDRIQDDSTTADDRVRPEGKGGRNRRRAATNNPVTDQGAAKLRTVRETSAGGLVISGSLDNPVDDLCAVLIGRVDRRGRMMWSLPKGHIETGETAEQTAIREVAEETGIAGTVVAPLGKIDYWFVSEGRRIHKTVHHYLLRSIGGELSDADYEVSEVAWVPLRELPRRLTYSDERRLARMARGVIADLAADPFRLAKSEAESIRTEPNAYEKAAAARNQRRNDPTPSARSRRRRRRARRPTAGDA
ncbi:NUDIX hydrolase [Gordonia sp. (in: high G+C Gram-positive bacteria)]|uniref:NUDIX hydrolase n=1 Tax=Gordonia sp. (in: high G+C Gram-positive bacteria) TaxID=84139 RepID=UPI0025C55CF3|nr:NUDIX hydrolase [Gordonia sp. (in: high G+C Gram-positive bacteria)]HMS74374.1 NUDIX hydrolase [Gordonia sp. (in: high G+C Gram-positive bacteria)]